jgi:hypothetical protein
MKAGSMLIARSPIMGIGASVAGIAGFLHDHFAILAQHRHHIDRRQSSLICFA